MSPGIFDISSNVSPFEQTGSDRKGRLYSRKDGLCMKKTENAASPKSAISYCVLVPLRRSGKDWQQRHNEARRRSSGSKPPIESKIGPRRKGSFVQPGRLAPTVANRTQSHPPVYRPQPANSV